MILAITLTRKWYHLADPIKPISWGQVVILPLSFNVDFLGVKFTNEDVKKEKKDKVSKSITKGWMINFTQLFHYVLKKWFIIVVSSKFIPLFFFLNHLIPKQSTALFFPTLQLR